MNGGGDTDDPAEATDHGGLNGLTAERPWLVPVAWALWVDVLASVIAVWSGDEVSTALLGGAALAALAGAGGYALRQREISERTVVETSAAPLLLAAGTTIALNGVAFGLWLLLIGLEVIAFGTALLLRDGRAPR